mgnify:CR=1 FL=1
MFIPTVIVIEKALSAVCPSASVALIVKLYVVSDVAPDSVPDITPEPELIDFAGSYTYFLLIKGNLIIYKENDYENFYISKNFIANSIGYLLMPLDILHQLALKFFHILYINSHQIFKFSYSSSIKP